MQSFLCRLSEGLQSVSLATLVTIEVTIVGLIVSWLQLRYMQRRDKELDIRNGWTETHKLMMNFRFKRELLNQQEFATYPKSLEVVPAVSESLHQLKGQLDRMPDCPLVEQLADFLHTNWEADKWRSVDFEKPFDAYAKQVALLSRPHLKARWMPFTT